MKSLEESSGFSKGKRTYSRIKNLFKAYGITDYTYGNFVGDIYYKGSNITSMDNVVIAPVTVERILEWIDNDATFVLDNNKETDRYWTATSEKALLEKELINIETVKMDTQASDGMLAERTREGFYYLDEKGRRYTTNSKKNLAINVDTNVENPELVKTIYPKISNMEIDPEQKLYEGIVTIRINSVLSAGNHEDNDMSYDAVAELVQFNTVTGRRTNFASSVGNLALVTGKTPFEKSTKEIDSFATEVIKLTPPTGLNKTHLILAYNIRLIEIVALLTMIVISSTTIIIYLKNKKKFYK